MSSYYYILKFLIFSVQYNTVLQVLITKYNLSANSVKFIVNGLQATPCKIYILNKTRI